MPDEEPEGLCEYELQRQRNIAANEEKLKELGIENNPLNLHIRGPATSGAAAAKKSKRKAAVAAATNDDARRTSRRLADLQAPAIYVAEEEEKSGRVTVGGKDAGNVAMETKLVREISPDNLFPVDKDDLLPVERDVFEVIRAARNEKARAMERSMFIVCNDRTMCEMVRTIPESLEDLGELYGMGAKKVARHGQMLLDALAPHVEELRAAHAAARAAAAPSDDFSSGGK